MFADNTKLISTASGCTVNTNTLLATPSAVACTLIVDKTLIPSFTINTLPLRVQISSPSTTSHVTVLFVAFEGNTSAFNVTTLLLFNSVLLALAVTEDTLIPNSTSISLDVYELYLLTTVTFPPFVAVSLIVNLPSFETVAKSLPSTIS